MNSVNTLLPRLESFPSVLQLTLTYLHSNKRVLTELKCLRQGQSLVYYNSNKLFPNISTLKQ